MELLKGYTGKKENLGNCEQFFMEMMKVPRVESKLRILSFKIKFVTQVRRSLHPCEMLSPHGAVLLFSY